MSFALLPVGGWGEETDEISDYLKISPVKIQEIVIEKLNCLQKDAYEAKTPHVAKLPEKSTLLKGLVHDNAHARRLSVSE